MNLISSLGKRGVDLGLFSKKVEITDTEYLSKYFQVSEFNPKFTPGKNSISFNGSDLLKIGGEIQVQCNDSSGNPLYVELAEGEDTAYKESSAFVVSIYIFGDTSEGAGKLGILGITKSGKLVRWAADITIDKSIPNTSKVRFYYNPTIEVDPVQVPMLSSALSSVLTKVVILSGSFHTYAASPRKDTTKLTINRSTSDVDYRLISNTNFPPEPSSSINSQMEGFDATLYVNKIKQPFSYKDLVVNQTQSIKISKVIDAKTLKLVEPYYYEDSNNKKIVSEISNGVFSIQYPYISYNSASTAFQTIGSGSNSQTIYYSYADITYRNLKTFSGYIARHKLYRRSLYSAGDFEIIADEPLTPKELLLDDITLNKSFSNLGKFYNQYHINRYWFTQPAVQLTHRSSSVIDSMHVSAGEYSDFNGNYYLILKNDSSNQNRNATYIPYNESEFLKSSGSSFDCNFVELKKDVQYVLSSGVVMYKNRHETSKLEFYFTSSISAAKKEPTYSTKHGIKIGEIVLKDRVETKYFSGSAQFVYSPQNDLFGTIVVVPTNCFILLNDVSFKPFGDDGFSPEILNTRIPFPVGIANESFEIKAELFDINSNLVYSGLRTIQFFDPSGSTLNSYMPGYTTVGDTSIPGDLIVSGSLSVKQSVFISGSNLHLGSLSTCPTPPYVLGYNNDGTICKTTPGGSGTATYDTEYIYISSVPVQISLMGSEIRITAI